jgi:translation elongation factor EF-1beta
MLQAEEYPFDLHMLMKTSILPADVSCGLYEMKESVKNKLQLLVQSNAIACDF